MSATAGTTDQVMAHMRDLTPGQRVEFILAMTAHIEKHAEILSKAGLQSVAGPIGLAASLAGVAAVQLRETVPGECVGDVLAQIAELVYGR